MLDAYSYQAEVEWIGRRAGRLTGEGLPPLDVSAPAEFSGESGLWTPEHFLVAATSSCLMTTFLALAELSKLPVSSLRIRATGRVEKVPGDGYRFTKVTLAPEIGVAAEQEERARKVLAKAEKNCFISNSLRAAVEVEPHFLHTPAGVLR